MSNTCCSIAYAGDELDDSVGVLEDAVLALDVGAHQLNVLGQVRFRGAYPGLTFLDVIEETLGEGRVLVEIDQMGSLKY